MKGIKSTDGKAKHTENKRASAKSQSQNKSQEPTKRGKKERKSHTMGKKTKPKRTKAQLPTGHTVKIACHQRLYIKYFTKGHHKSEQEKKVRKSQ